MLIAQRMNRFCVGRRRMAREGAGKMKCIGESAKSMRIVRATLFVSGALYTVDRKPLPNIFWVVIRTTKH